MEEIKFSEELIEKTGEEKNKTTDQSLYKQVLEMSVSDKIKLALVGNMEARSLLIKDINKVVIQAVINNPRLTDGEAESYASNRNYPKEVTRLIAGKKELLKNYNVKLALVCNAKTPLPTALKLLNFIRERDLGKISKNKNIPAVIARTAMKMLDSRGRGKRG
jgi:hypothetical protein